MKIRKNPRSAFRVPHSKIDVLLLQVGTPDSATTAGLRRFLREFLGDPRVLEMSALVRWLLVHFVIVPFRSPRSAKKYRRIWDEKTGSPLLEITRRQTKALSKALGKDFGVRFAMRYGNPSIDKVVHEMVAQGCRKLIVLPMFPQYSATTSASGLDALFGSLRKERVLPSIRLIGEFHDDAGYLDAVASRIERTLAEAKQAGQTPEMNLVSFHGLPIDYIHRGDPYSTQVETTAKRIAERMGWADEDWQLVYQSRFGRSQWLEPFADETLRQLGSQGVRTVLIVQPGFTADCLETIDEIGYEGQREFQKHGGEVLIRVPCLNDEPEFIEALRKIVEREAAGWR